VRFADVSDLLPKSGKLGMVTDAVWIDTDLDKKNELIVVGEWMPVSVISFRSDNDKIATSIKTLSNTTGWWNCIAAADFDNDGDTDLVAGNLGQNSRYKASTEKPIAIYASDYDKNGRVDPVISQYIDEKNYISHSRDLLIKQINAMRVRFRTYKEYGERTFDKSFSKQELAEATVYKAGNLSTTYFEGDGKGDFEIKSLPIEVQTAPINDFLLEDLNADGHLDIIPIGNSHSTEVSIGKYDAYKGGILLYNKDGNFKWKSAAESNLAISGDAKSIVSLKSGRDNLILTGINNGKMEQILIRNPVSKKKLLTTGEVLDKDKI